MSITIVLGTRPELIKMAPVMISLDEMGLETMFIHTGQHYDDNLSSSFISDLEIKQPDKHLGVGTGTQAFQTAETMKKIESIFMEDRPEMVLVQGDTNAVLSGALTAVKMGIEVGHVEAGLRSNDRRMPEEYNRRVTDHISHLLFAPTKETEDILHSEKVWGEVFLTGNTVIDACERNIKLAAEKSHIIDKVNAEEFILVTSHRAENVDDPVILKGLVDVLVDSPIPIVFPMHPRTKKRLNEFGIWDTLNSSKNVEILPPVGYFDFLVLMQKSRFILTDSGGIQEEATSPSIRKRVLVFRNSTERPEAIETGYATMVGTEKNNVSKKILEEVQSNNLPQGTSPYGNGNSGKIISKIVASHVNQ